jgi:hypothetical protein
VSGEREIFVVERRALVRGAVLALLLLAATGVGVAIGVRAGLFSYLLAFAYWGGISLASLLLLMILHTARARWVVVFRRPLEAMAATAPLFVLLFLPVGLGLRALYPWVDPDPRLGGEVLALLAHKRPYLNVPFFLIRAAIYLLFATFVGSRLFGWSLAQDLSGDPDFTRRQRALGAGALPAMALVFAFASFDWLMSLTPLWYSTMFGVYFFAGSFLAAIALLTLFVTLGAPAAFSRLASVEHLHSLGKLLLAFTCFWAYIAFSQLLLIWIANLPEEVPFYAFRIHGAWGAVGVALILSQFVLPFAALLSRSLKRNRRALALVAGWILMAHFVDLYWVVMPTLDPERLVFPWPAVTAFLGTGLATIVFVLWRLQGRNAVPVGDPYLAHSLRYRQP